MKALIAGGGIGGLATALFLNSVGIEAEVLQRDDEIGEFGGGINMLPHAVKGAPLAPRPAHTAGLFS